jgi:hypothetical protein
MDSNQQEMKGPASPPRTRGYDHVLVRDPSGKSRQLSRSEFEGLPLRERVTYLIGGTAEFFSGGAPVSASDAMKE